LLGHSQHPPTDLHSLFIALRVVAVEERASIPVAGFLQKERGSYRIICAAGQSPERRRFTIAHELGHAILETTGPRAPQVGSELERLCDQLATELLMPSRAFSAAIAGRAPSCSVIRDLASKFQTSITATALRCLAYWPVSLVNVQHGSARWCRGPARPDRHHLNEIIGQKFDCVSGDGILFLNSMLGSGKPHTTEWLSTTHDRSGLLLIAPMSFR
jgi:hypothetical protein